MIILPHSRKTNSVKFFFSLLKGSREILEGRTIQNILSFITDSQHRACVACMGCLLRWSKWEIVPCDDFQCHLAAWQSRSHPPFRTHLTCRFPPRDLFGALISCYSKCDPTDQDMLVPWELGGNAASQALLQDLHFNKTSRWLGVTFMFETFPLAIRAIIALSTYQWNAHDFGSKVK